MVEVQRYLLVIILDFQVHKENMMYVMMMMMSTKTNRKKNQKNFFLDLNLLYFVEMNFNIDLSTQHITLHDRISDLVACIYKKTILDRQYVLQTA